MKYSKEDIREFIISLIEKKAKLPKNGNLEALNYVESGYVDSMGLIKFIVDIERKFDISIFDNDIEDIKFQTIGGLMNIIYHKVKNKDYQ